MADDAPIVVLRWKCTPCMPVGLYAQGLIGDELNTPPREPALHPCPECTAGNATMRLQGVTWLADKISLEDVWKVVGRIAHPELFVVSSLEFPFPGIVRRG